MLTIKGSTRWTTCLLALLLNISLAACSDPDTSGDSPDAMTADSGMSEDADDAEDLDAGDDADASDTDGPDAAEVDSEFPDVDEPDAEVPDADEPDAELPDADEPDADANPGLPDGPSSERFRAVPLSSDEGAAPNGFYEYLPPGYGDGEPRPLMIFWHGFGENGDGTTQLHTVLRHGPPKLQNNDQWPSDRPFVVLSPQNMINNCPRPEFTEAFIAWAVENYDIDEDRVYLTGLSCGAHGSWRYLSEYTNTRVAAAVLIAGDGRQSYMDAGCELGRVPIWGFHGDNDAQVPVRATENPINWMIRDCPRPPRRETLKTIYEGVGHDSWTRTYDLSAGHDIYTWMLSKTR